MSSRPEPLPGRRLNGRPPFGGLALRSFALAMVVFGGLLAGGALNGFRTEGERGFARAYTAAWIVRAGKPAEWIYDPARFTTAAEEIAPTGAWKPFGLSPPASLALPLPFTIWKPASAAWVFAFCSLLALLASWCRLGSLAGAAFWNRSESLLLAGFALGSPLFLAALAEGSNVPWSVCLLAIAFAFWERGRRSAASICFGALFAFSGFGIVLCGFLLRRGFRREAGLVAGAGILLTIAAILGFGFDVHMAWARSLWQSIPLPASLDSSTLPALLSRLFSPDPTRNVSAIARAPLVPAIVTVVASFWFWRGIQPQRLGDENELDALGGRSESARDLSAAIAMASLLDPMAAGGAVLFALVPVWTGLRIAVLRDLGARRLWFLIALGWLALGPLGADTSFGGPFHGWIRAAGLFGLSLWLSRVPPQGSMTRSAPRLRLVPAA